MKKPETLLDQVLDQIKKDVRAGDMTAIAELLDTVSEKDFRGFLSEGESPQEDKKLVRHSILVSRKAKVQKTERSEKKTTQKNLNQLLRHFLLGGKARAN